MSHTHSHKNKTTAHKRREIGSSVVAASVKCYTCVRVCVCVAPYSSIRRTQTFSLYLVLFSEPPSTLVYWFYKFLCAHRLLFVSPKLRKQQEQQFSTQKSICRSVRKRKSPPTPTPTNRQTTKHHNFFIAILLLLLHFSFSYL